MKLVERFFGDLTREVVRESSDAGVKQLIGSIMDFLAEPNMDPRPSRWRANGEDTLARPERARAAGQAARQAVIPSPERGEEKLPNVLQVTAAEKAPGARPLPAGWHAGFVLGGRVVLFPVEAGRRKEEVSLELPEDQTDSRCLVNGLAGGNRTAGEVAVAVSAERRVAAFIARAAARLLRFGAAGGGAGRPAWRRCRRW